MLGFVLVLESFESFLEVTDDVFDAAVEGLDSTGEVEVDNDLLRLDPLELLLCGEAESLGIAASIGHIKSDIDNATPEHKSNCCSESDIVLVREAGFELTVLGGIEHRLEVAVWCHLNGIGGREIGVESEAQRYIRLEVDAASQVDIGNGIAPDPVGMLEHFWDALVLEGEKFEALGWVKGEVEAEL